MAPAIAALQPAARVIRHRRIKCFGVGESQLEAMLPDLIRRGREPIGRHHGERRDDHAPHHRGGRRRRGVPGGDGADRRRSFASALGTLVFGEEDDELEHVVARLLREQGKTLAVAEWATGGLVEDWLQAAAPDDAELPCRWA